MATRTTTGGPGATGQMSWPNVPQPSPLANASGSAARSRWGGQEAGPSVITRWSIRRGGGAEVPGSSTLTATVQGRCPQAVIMPKEKSLVVGQAGRDDVWPGLVECELPELGERRARVHRRDVEGEADVAEPVLDQD